MHKIIYIHSHIHKCKSILYTYTECKGESKGYYTHSFKVREILDSDNNEA